jgi:UDP-N-acetylmuramoyl-L-alanyl-D-glutamate--2,6-diaminopimelate ligase
MKDLNSILEDVRTLERSGPDNPKIRSICFDSRLVCKGDVFIAVPGTLTDGHQYISQALDSGALAVICETIPDELKDGVTYVRVNDSAEALGLCASNSYGRPSGKIKVIGITGTNGKTTVASLLYHTFRDAGIKAGLISTVRNMVGERELEASHTTPDALQLHRLLAEMVAGHCNYCFMEVSSHAIHQKRIAGIEFGGGIFTNITHDHLDYHKTFKEYLRVKKSFFDALPSSAFAIINEDDKNGKVMGQNCSASRSSFGMNGMRDYKCRILEHQLDGMHLILDNNDFWTRFAGSFNAYNLLAVYGCAVECGIDKQETLVLLSKQAPVKGRFETLPTMEGITAIVDYAHTPDALRNVLSTIIKVNNSKTGLITVLGAGGNRDASKRPEMGQIAAELSSRVILTSDNPRDESPGDIINQMLSGISEEMKTQVLSIPDRREAIKTAVMLASEGDIILVAGKGHETYQEIKGKKIHFDDREVLEEFLVKPSKNADLSV